VIYRAFFVPENALAELVPIPPAGRTFSATRPVRFGDLSPGGRLRLDAIARYLQDVSSDDTTDAALEDDVAWVVRKLVVEVHRPPAFRERLALTTWCSGTGSRWAERRVSMTGAAGATIEAGVLWVRVDRETGRPVPLAPDFWAIYGPSAGGRKVGARLAHDPAPPPDADRTAWPLRFADFDLLGHVNNAAYWAAVEEALADRRGLRPPFRAEVEYREAMVRGSEPDLARIDLGGELRLWLVDRVTATTYASARVVPLASTTS
jgi:acyl-ACP thioesterase